MKAASAVCLAVLLVSSMPGCTATRSTVSEASILEFFEIVDRGDFHEMARAGKEVFEEGLYIPDHAELFAHLASSEPDSGRVRYVLYSFKGQASVGEVYLILESDSGKIVEFGHIEAWFE